MAAPGWLGTLCHPSGPVGSDRHRQPEASPHRASSMPQTEAALGILEKKAAFLKGSPTGKQELGCPAPHCTPRLCPCRSVGNSISEALLLAAPGEDGAAVGEPSLWCRGGARGCRVPVTAGPGRREGTPETPDVVVLLL